MRSESLHTGIEGKVLASLLLRMFDEPNEKRGAKSARAVGIVRDEIVDVKRASGEKQMQDAKARHGADDPVQLEKRKLVPLLLLAQHLGNEIDGLDVGTQFTHDGAAAADLFGRVREADSPFGYLRSGHGVFIARAALRSSAESKQGQCDEPCGDKKLVACTDLSERLSL